MANVPAYNTNNISLGPAIVYLGLSGTTPSHDIGAIANGGLQVSLAQKYLAVYQGSPKQLAKQFKTEELMDVKIQGLEWNLIDLAIALGAGVTTSSGSQDTFAFGGDPNTAVLAVKIVHSMPIGHTLNFYFWQAQISGDWSLKMAQDTLHEFPYSFNVLASTTSWDGTTLASGQQLFKIVRQKT